MNNASFTLNFAGRHTALSCNIDALCLLRQAEYLLVKSSRSHAFLTQMLGVFATNLLIC